MLEIVAVFFWARHIGRMVEAKGHRPNSYRWLTAGLWFGGEAIGFVVGAIVTGRADDLAPIYFFALLGAASGAAIAWLVARSLYPVPAAQRPGAPWPGRQPGAADFETGAAVGEQATGHEAAAGQAHAPSLPSTGWQPTHVVPQGGMQAWAAPDPSQPPVATLPPGLDLALERRLGDWAEVRAVNGWSGWVDARLLWERPAVTVR